MRSFLILAALSLPLAASTTAFADPVVVNGGFEAGAVSFSNYFLGTPIAGWTQGGNTENTGVDSLAGPDVNFTTHTGTYAAILGPASVGGTGSLSQTITDHAGDIDSLSFWLASECFSGLACNPLNVNGAPGPEGPDATKNSFGYSIANASSSLTNVVETGNGTNATYVKYSLLFLATGSDTISFNFSNDDDYFALDDVSVSVVTPGGSPVPEPSSLMLLGTGIVGMAGAARRKFLGV